MVAMVAAGETCRCCTVIKALWLRRVTVRREAVVSQLDLICPARKPYDGELYSGCQTINNFPVGYTVQLGTTQLQFAFSRPHLSVLPVGLLSFL